MRSPASEKAEIISLVEQSHLPVRRTLEKLGIPQATFHRWYDLYQTGGPEALEDRPCRPSRVWNRIPEEIRTHIVNMASSSLISRPGNSRCASPTSRSTSSRRLRCTAC